MGASSTGISMTRLLTALLLALVVLDIVAIAADAYNYQAHCDAEDFLYAASESLGLSPEGLINQLPLRALDTRGICNGKYRDTSEAIPGMGKDLSAVYDVAYADLVKNACCCEFNGGMSPECHEGEDP